jgi:hypothetical protein
MEEQQIIDIWDIFKDYISEKSKDIAANHYIDFLVGQDIDTSIIESLKGYDIHLDHAIELVLEDEQEKQDFEEDNWDDPEEDEDY